MARTAGTFVQTTPGHKWHRIENGEAVCGASLVNGEWWTTDQMTCRTVCDDCTVSVICEDDECPHIATPHSHAA